MKDVLWPYHFLEKAHCGISTCPQLHNHGYLITTIDGLETGIGSDCGQNIFGLKFTQQRQVVDQEVARRRRIRSVKEMIKMLPSMISSLAKIKNDYDDLQEQKQRLMDAIGPGVYAVLKQRADRDDAQIKRSVRLAGRDLAAYHATNNRSKGHQEDAPYREEIIASLEGLPFIRTCLKDMLITNLLDPLRELGKSNPDDVDLWKRGELQKTAKWVGEFPQNLIKAQEIIASGRRFFTSANVSHLIYLGASAASLKQIIADLKVSESSAPGT